MPERPQEPDPVHPPASPPLAGRRARVLGFALIAITAVLAPSLLIRVGRVDSAALFVGVPLLIAVSIVLMPTPKNLHGLTFRVVTFVLLITSAYLHEGAACVLMAAPLVYGVAHFFVQMVELKRRDREDARRSRWTFTMAGDPIETEVVERAPGRLGFKVVRDESKTRRWLTWQGGTVTWHPQGASTAVRIEITFVRRLDPSWYFGPIESAMVGAGLDHFTDALGLADAH